MPIWMPVTIYATLLMGYLGIHAWRTMDDSIGRRPLVMLIFLTEVTLLTDFYGRFEGYEGVTVSTLYGATIITFLMLPALGVEWFQFVRNVLSAEERLRLRPVGHVVTVAAGVGIVVSMLSPVTSWVFFYDAQGAYHRGELFLVPALSTFFIFVVTDIFLFTQVKSLERYSIRMLGSYPIPVIIGAALALVVADVPWMPLGFSIAILILFAHMQNTGMSRDYLTGLYNRMKLEGLMAEYVSRVKLGHKFAAIMMDIDNFKRINDTYGHTVGDIALAETARLLQRSVRSGDAIARFGGDEFFILLDMDSEDNLEDIVARIEKEEDAFAQENSQYELRLSKGYAFYDAKKFSGVKDFMAHLDELMYENKRLRHAQAAARGDLYSARAEERGRM